MSLIHNNNAKIDQTLRKHEKMIMNRVNLSDFNYKTNNIMNTYAKLSDLK